MIDGIFKYTHRTQNPPPGDPTAVLDLVLDLVEI
jgi:hypothetical protein